MIKIKENFNRYSVDTNGKIFDKKYQRYSRTFKSNKYIQCRLVDNEGKIHIMGVHSVIAMFHMSDYFLGCVVHHKDGNTINNTISNLECLSRSKHSALHANPTHLCAYTNQYGPWNKGKKMSSEFCKKCSESAKRRWGIVKR